MSFIYVTGVKFCDILGRKIRAAPFCNEDFHMRPISTKRFLDELRRQTQPAGLTFSLKRGLGSHLGLIFQSIEDPEIRIHLVLSELKEISPGVQKALLSAVNAYSDRISWSDRLRDIIKNILDTDSKESKFGINRTGNIVIDGRSTGIEPESYWPPPGEPKK